MTVSNSQKPNQQIITKLQSKNEELVLETIEQLRSTGNLSYLPFLFEILRSSLNTQIKQAILKLLADIKHIGIIPQLLAAIQDEKNAEIRKDLVSICWENGLDFCTNLPLFVDLVIKEELEVAFEAYTVIINMEGKITTEMLDSETGKMEAVLNKHGEQKKQLLIDIIDYLPQLSD